NGIRALGVHLLGGLAVLSAMPSMSVRFVLFGEPLLRGLAAVGLHGLAERLFPRHRATAFAALLALVAALEIGQFQRIFVGSKLYDPVTAALVEAAGFVRPPAPGGTP